MPKSCSLPFQTLLDWHEGRLAPDGSDAIAVRQHLETNCRNCQETLHWLAETLPVLPEAVAPAPSPSHDAIAYANGLARLLRPARSEEGLLSTVRRHIAQRVLGGGAQPGLTFAGARGGTLPAMQRAFETETHSIRLWEEPDTGDRRYLIGQIYERGNPEARALPFQLVTLLPPGYEKETLAEQEGSEFHFAGVAPGVYLIRCLLENDEIILPQVEVGRA